MELLVCGCNRRVRGRHDAGYLLCRHQALKTISILKIEVICDGSCNTGCCSYLTSWFRTLSGTLDDSSRT